MSPKSGFQFNLNLIIFTVLNFIIDISSIDIIVIGIFEEETIIFIRYSGIFFGYFLSYIIILNVI